MTEAEVRAELVVELGIRYTDEEWTAHLASLPGDQVLRFEEQRIKLSKARRADRIAREMGGQPV